MTTAREIITPAMRHLGVVAQGEVPTAEEAQDALSMLNNLLDLWSLENMLIVADTITTVTLLAGKQTYTIGEGAEIDVVWPIQIEQAQLRIITTLPNLELPLRILNETEYGLTRIKDLRSTYPQAIFQHTTYPTGTLFLWPVPDEQNEMVLWHKGLVAAFTSLSTPDVSLPRGYRLALEYNLAEHLAPQYGIDIKAGSIIDRKARETRAIIKRSNSKKRLAFIDVPSGQRQDYGSYNWRTDGHGSRA